MSYRPDLRIFADTDDITEDVIALDIAHGVNIFGVQTGFGRTEMRGEMLLENWHDEYGVTELDSLGTIELRTGMTVLCRFVVLEYEFNRRDRLVRCTLATPTPTAYLGNVIINAGNVPGASGMSLSLSQVLGASGVTINPLAPLAATLNMDQGTVYEAGIAQFLDDFAVAADGFVFENHLGAFQFMAWADNRPSTLQITPADLWIEDDSAESYRRRGWRRDAQIVSTLDITYIVDGGTFDTGHRIRDLGYWQTFPGVSRVRLLHMTPLRDIGGLTYNNADIDRFAYHSMIDSTFHVANRPPPFTGTIPDWQFGVGTPYISRDDPREVLVRVHLESSGTEADQANFDDLWLRQDYRITSHMYPDEFTENKFRLLARDDGQTLLGERPQMPWPLDDAALPGAGNRLVQWQDRVPRVTKLCFPLIQQTQARFESLVNHRIGSISSMEVRVNGLDVAGFMANLYVRWRYQRSGYSCVEMHFIELSQHAEQRPLYADTGRPLEAEDGAPIYVE